MNEAERIALALSCRDCEGLPRVPDAGGIEETEAGRVQIMHNGLRLRTDSHYGDYNVEVIRGLRGHHEPQEEAIFHEVVGRLGPGAVMLELGAFWAYYSLWFLKAVREARAVLVEPVPSALEAGQRNFAINAEEGRFIHAAIGSAPAPEAALELWKGMTVTVPTVSVDSLLAAEGIERLAILHADIQGHEVAMLHGAATALAAKRIDWVFISTHGENIHQRCMQLLRRAGYRIAAEHSPGESHSVDGLIVAAAHDRRPLPPPSRRRAPGVARARLRAAVRVRLLEPLGIKPVTT